MLRSARTDHRPPPATPVPARKDAPPRLRVLVSAYYCNPRYGSESGVGWNCVKALADHHDVWAIVRGDEREGVEEHLRTQGLPNTRFIFFELPQWLRSGGFGSRKKPAQIYYYIWQICIFFIARKLHRQHNFHVAHHVTLVKYWAPCFLAFLPIPLLWGPVGGGEQSPGAFWRGFSRRGKLYECVRDVARWLGECDPFVRATARRAALSLATSRETAARIQAINGGGPLRTVPAIGVSEAELAEFASVEEAQESPPADRPIRFVSIGRLLHWKGFHLGIAAFARANIPQAEYWIVGSGPESDRLQQLARELGVGDAVTLRGHLSRRETLQALGQATALVHPSLHESGGGVCLEAMAANAPVIALDLGGPAEHHAGGAGILVAANDPVQAVAELAAAMRRLADDPGFRQAIASRARQRLLDSYAWEKKALLYSEFYSEILEKSGHIDVSVG